MSVEADIFLRHGQLRVAHTVLGIRKRKTLKNLYLEPLRKRIKEQGGKVYSKGPMEFELMIDLKDGGPDMMLALKKQLLEYQDILTIYTGGKKVPGAVRVILSGGQNPRDYRLDDPRVYSSDGGLPLFDTTLDSSLVPRVSTSYRGQLKWRGRGPIPPDEKQKLQQMMAHAKQYGRKSRLWATPNKEAIWKEQLDAGQYWINVDDLARFRKFYLAYKGLKEEQVVKK
jgi:hypothetical protein